MGMATILSLLWTDHPCGCSSLREDACSRWWIVRRWCPEHSLYVAEWPPIAFGGTYGPILVEGT
jgi:hypothetical protein